jgi:hypothetical protein
MTFIQDFDNIFTLANRGDVSHLHLICLRSAL